MFDLTLKIPNKDVSNYKRDLVCVICKKKKKVIIIYVNIISAKLILREYLD